MKRFWAWGFVIGDYLPDNSFKLGEATIRKIPPEQLLEMRGLSRSVQYVQGIPLGHSVAPGQVFVLSDWAIEWTIEADNFESVERVVQLDLAPMALTALNTLSNIPYRIELMRVAELDDNGRVVGGIWQTFFNPDSSLRVCNPPPRQISGAAIEHLNSRLATLRGNPKAGRASAYYNDAIAATHFWSGHQVLAYAPLIGFHLCIELVIQDIGRHQVVEDAARVEQEEVVVKSLANALKLKLDIHQAIRCIRQAHLDLNKIAHADFRTILFSATNLLGIDPATADRLDKFYSFRNDYLGHPNKMLEELNIAPWVDEAQELARVVLSSYLDMLGQHPLPPDFTLAEGPFFEPFRTWCGLQFQSIKIFLDPQ